jgi:hypothetical protein
MYYLSILSIFKNETLNLKLWLEHYLWQGVQHFYLIDNGSTDNPLNILQEYINKGFVSYFYLPEQHNQLGHYREVFDKENLKDKTYWLCICDLDEFFYGVDKILLNKIQKLQPYIDYILCNWIVFGSDGNINHPKDIRTSITSCKKNFCPETKYIFKTKIINNSSQINIHKLENINLHKSRIRIANKLIRLNHYQIQSIEYFTKVKMIRGDVIHVNSDNIRNMNYFLKCDYKETTCEKLKNNVLNYGLSFTQTPPHD